MFSSASMNIKLRFSIYILSCGRDFNNPPSKEKKHQKLLHRQINNEKSLQHTSFGERKDIFLLNQFFIATIYNQKNKKISFSTKGFFFSCMFRYFFFLPFVDYFLFYSFILFNIHNDRSFIMSKNIQSTYTHHAQ